MKVNRMRVLALKPGATHFDRSSWITLSIVMAIFIATLGVVIASYNMPMDGWDIDRGAWGRYDNPVYLDGNSGESDLQAGDILLAVEGVPFEQLEARVASLDLQRPLNWKVGEIVHYTVLRNGEEVAATATLARPPLLRLYRPQILIENPILLTFPIFLLISILVFALRPGERAAQLPFLFGFAFFNEDFLSYAVVPPGVADLFSNVTYWPKIMLGNMVWSFISGTLLVHLLAGLALFAAGPGGTPLAGDCHLALSAVEHRGYYQPHPGLWAADRLIGPGVLWGYCAPAASIFNRIPDHYRRFDPLHGGPLCAPAGPDPKSN